MIEVQGLRRMQAGRNVLDGIDLHWTRGVLCLRGENGSGKTTLLRVLGGLLPWDEGAVHLAGASLRDDRARALRAVGFVAERSDVPGSLTPREVAALVAAMRDVAAPDDDTARSYGLDGIFDVRRDGLSLGQRRRADLLAAMVGSPRVLLLDEPTNGLDAATTAWLAGRLRAHGLNGGAAIVATHDAGFAEACADATAWLDAGVLRLVV